jgi:hypothetical protein
VHGARAIFRLKAEATRQLAHPTADYYWWTGNRELVTTCKWGNWKPETGNWKLVTGNW